MADIFVVTTGSYSDYRLVAVFETRDRAAAYVAECDAVSPQKYENGEWSTYYGADMEIEVFPLNEPPERPESIWYATIKTDGTVISARYINASWVGQSCVHPAGGPHRSPFEATCFAGTGESPEHARRKAEDFRRAWLASPAAAEYAAKEGEIVAMIEAFNKAMATGGTAAASVTIQVVSGT